MTGVGYCLKELTEENLKLFGYDHKGEFKVEDFLNIEILMNMGFEYGIVYNFDSVLSDRIGNIKLDSENIIEARFFNENGEMRIFCDEGVFSGCIFIEKGNCVPIVQKWLLYPRYGETTGYAEELTVKKYIDYDKEDGQAFISYVKPSKLNLKE